MLETNKYPYTDFHELNLDWVIMQISKLNNDWSEFRIVNSIKWMGSWNISKQYPKWSIVDDNGFGYISIKDVPNGITLDNTDYWVLVGNYSALYASIQSKLYYVTPEEFGAYGDGIHDDTKAIKEAIEKHNIIQLKGTYKITDGLIIDDNYYLYGNGATLLADGYFDMITIRGNNNYINNLIINGNADDNASPFTGVKIQGSNNKLESVKVINTKNFEDQSGHHSGIFVYGDFNSFINCVLENNYGTGLFLYNNNNCEIIGGYGKNNKGSSISGACDYLVISDFISLNAGYTGISLNGKSNTCINCISNKSIYSGFTLGHYQGDADNTVLSNCIAEENTLDGISIFGGVNITIDNCNLKDNIRSNVRVDNAYSDCIISNTVFINTHPQINANTLSKVIADGCKFIGVGSLNITNASLDMINCDSESNTAYFVVLNNANCIIDKCKFTNKYAGNANAVHLLTAPSVLKVYDTLFDGYNYNVYCAVAGNDVNINTVPEKTTYNHSNATVYVNKDASNIVNIILRSIATGSQDLQLDDKYKMAASFSLTQNGITLSYNSGTNKLTINPASIAAIANISFEALPYKVRIL